MQIFIWTLIVSLSVILDQITKLIAVNNLKSIGSCAFIEGFIRFHYVENTGAAFGMMKNFRWFFISVSSIAIVVIVFYLLKYRRSISCVLGISLSMIIGGGIGNQIDRILNGYVVDFIEPIFVNFAVFNIADCFITVGTVLVIVDFIFIDRHLLVNKKNHNASPTKSGEAKDD